MSEEIKEVKVLSEEDGVVKVELPDKEVVEVNKEEIINEPLKEDTIKELEEIDKKKHPNKQKKDEVKEEPKDLVDRQEVLAKLEPALIRIRRNGLTVPTREVIALLNGIITDIKAL